MKEAKLPYGISFAEGVVYRGTSVVALSKRELEVVLYLASQGRSCSTDEIVDALWPQRQKYDSTILRVTVLRARSRLGSADIILASNGTYRLADDVTVDLSEMEELLTSARPPIDTAVRENIKASVKRLKREPTILNLHECFAPIVLRIGELRHRMAIALARDALDRRDCEAALEVLSLLVAFDPYDEPARELRIRAYLAMGDRAAAFREYRVYRDLVVNHLGVKPSMALERVLTPA
jgi:DNA-binding SARP family transcriptional activator